MSEFKILFLGGGKRVSLCNRFNTAAAELGLKLKSYAYESSVKQPISKCAEILIGKEWDDPEVTTHLRQIISMYDIDLVVSNVDPATLVHAKLSVDLNAASISCSEFTTALCLSKIDFQEFCDNNNLVVIPEAKADEFPSFAKPDRGSASAGTRLILDKHDLAKLDKESEILIQKYISGTEYTVDAYVTKSGSICGVSPRIRVATAGGESTITETVLDEEIIELSKEVIAKLQLIGPLTIQFIRQSSTRKLYLMEVNPRFAGGVIASIEAGFDFPRMMILEVLGQQPTRIISGKKLIMKRYFMEEFYAADN